MNLFKITVMKQYIAWGDSWDKTAKRDKYILIPCKLWKSSENWLKIVARNLLKFEIFVSFVESFNVDSYQPGWGSAPFLKW